MQVIIFLNAFASKAQDTLKPGGISLSGYAEIYYCYDFSKPGNHVRPPFIYNYNKHNEVNLNLWYLKANYSNEKVRANLGFMSGTYSQYNLAHEPPVFQFVYEANAGIKLSEKRNLWLDAGIMPSHIGFESATGFDCWNLTRSLLAENSPYYECGVKLSHTSKNDKWYLAVMYLNGWQRIQRVNGNNTPAIGTQLTYKQNTNSAFNWSTYFGNEFPDSLRRWRLFNNFYEQLQLSSKIGLTLGFDIGIQQKQKAIDTYDAWYSPVMILRYKIMNGFFVAGRVEYYRDDHQVIIAAATPNGFQTYGYSVNLDYLPRANVVLRLEGRTFSSKDKIFILDGRASSLNYFITGSLAVKF